MIIDQDDACSSFWGTKEIRFGAHVMDLLRSDEVEDFKSVLFRLFYISWMAKSYVGMGEIPASTPFSGGRHVSRV